MGSLEMEFVLDAQLAGDSILLGEFPLCRLLLINDRQFPWFVLVPRRAETYEFYHLSSQDRQQMMLESCELSALLAEDFSATKMNVAALGNVVKQLHVHHVVRFDTDVAWPAPIWGRQPLIAYAQNEIESIRKQINALLRAKLNYVPAV